jgi:hypothetical protein
LILLTKMLRDYFADQISANRIVTPDAERKVTYKRVWSGKLITAGDKVLYAYAQDASGNLLLFSLLERELEELDPLFDFVGMENETVPVLKRRR